MKNNRYTLRALSQLLSYPDAAQRAQLPQLMPVLKEEDALSAARQAELQTLVTHLQRLDSLDAESRYVETFDRGRATCLHLFEHVHGDSRDRGPAMIDLTKTYEQSGLFLSPDELPDHLCVVLEFASTQPPEVAKSFLGEMAHILNAIFSALLKRESPYAVVLAAVLELAGHKAQAVQIVADEPLDESWSEPEAFDGCSTRGQARPGEAQPVHIVRKTSTQTRGVAA
ncbi:nitrate reductase molybdenum cofactor assembly chaperone [Limnohabitans sp. 103DPR2]|uniref:nitrate reductase molybdenum cofactor assembly chaperone n=1 Tax=Limnohabitans sp. 103DPR2 TaxID=1678129 RepID=UPI0006DBF09E|nr:nitrate reductase molybdenum cofactor assembly chaperone [Limnohabitans sp. 103DPR2]ALK93050.1 Nitrate reductase molybdenum cofactor assembly chaperone NarJ [Limnohabitans sp. 103DPR2]